MALTRITPNNVKFELHAYDEVYDLSLESINNWKNLEFTLKRDGFSGVFHQISFPFEFVKDAYDIMKGIFDEHQYRARGDMYIYLLKNNWAYEEEKYHEPNIFNLDWTTYNKSDTIIKIDTRRTSLYDFLKARNRVNYDIPVSELKAEKQWKFDRLQLENTVNIRVYNFKNYGSQHALWESESLVVGTSVETSEVSVKDRIYVNTTPNESPYRSDLYFMEIGNLPMDSKIHIEMNIFASLYAGSYLGNYAEVEKGVMILTKEYNPDNPLENAIATREYIIREDKARGDLDWAEQIPVEVLPGDKLYLIVNYKMNGVPMRWISVEGTMQVLYQAKDEELDVDVIDPQIILQSLVDRMTDSKGIYTARIEDFNNDKENLIMISAAESIRGIEKTRESEPQVHTSYRDFVEWMNAYGYEQHVQDKALLFRKRGKGFRSDLIAIELKENECAGLKESVNNDLLYTGIKIGYKRKEIENTNVRFEFNGTHDYATDLAIEEHILELISPYRADCYGIEFLAQERGKSTTDDKADKDLFLVHVSEGDDHYLTIKSELAGNKPNDTLFNGYLNPFNMMRWNESLIGISVNKVLFAASDSNATIEIDEIALNTDWFITNGLYKPIYYNIASKNIQSMPIGENVNGLVRFTYKGEIYEGFIEEISKNPAWESETIWVLHKR